MKKENDDSVAIKRLVKRKMTSIPLRHVLQPPEKGINFYLSGKSIGIPNWGFERRTVLGPGIASPERHPSTLRL